MKDPTRRELMQELRKYAPNNDEFDYEEAIYWFAADYHGGQGSNLYSVLSTSDYHPGITQRRPSGEGRRLYEHLQQVFDSI